jgi:diadenosine tetraphosphatase ApaH/serine/threonine PP2A family protein phosphatase
MVSDARQAAEWTRTQLSADQLDFLGARPLSATDGDALYVHANAFAPDAWAYVEGRAEAVRSLQATDRRFTFCGHVHEPRLFHLGSTGKAADFVPVPGVPIPLSAQRRWLAIPGSAGQPRDGNPAACYATFEPGSGLLTFQRVAYDHDTAAAKVRAAGLPEAFAQRLVRGG